MIYTSGAYLPGLYIYPRSLYILYNRRHNIYFRDFCQIAFILLHQQNDCGTGSVRLNERNYPELCYQWFKNFMTIPSATSSSYKNTSNGDYYVTINDSVGCMDNSNPITVRDRSLSMEPFSPAGCQTLCGGKPRRLTLNPSANTYPWYFCGNNLTVQQPRVSSLIAARIYTVSLSKASGCSGNVSD